MKKRLISISAQLSITIFTITQLWAKDLPTFNQRLYSIPNGYTVSVTDNKTVAVNPVNGQFTDDPVKDVLTLGVDQTYPTYFSTSKVVTVTLQVDWWNSGMVQQSPFNITLTIHYHPLDNGIYQDKQSYSFINAYQFKFTVIEISVDGGPPQSNLPKNLYIDGSISVTRWYDFSGTAPAMLQLDTFDSDCDNISDQIRISWLAATEAEEYQLEWTFVNDYNGTGGYISPASLNYDFRANATRITTYGSAYIIPRLFDHGWLVCRVRALGRTSGSPHLILYGTWSLPNETATIQSIQSNLYSSINLKSSHENNKNWQLTTTFAEEGKKKEVLGYFDGSLRNRQTVTEINSDNNIIVGQTIYDYQGRPAVTALPVPVGDLCIPSGTQASIKYYDRFNQDSSGTEYSKENFDLANSNCGAQAEPMPATSGASRYYSENNSDKNSFQAFVPDALQYPFSEVEYTPDNTGRIRRQGGVGPQFQLGSQHETFYYYGKPQQLEADRLFGSEAGDASHYQKNFVIDPNSQVSASYLDQEGRVIATSLVGDPGIGLSPLPSAATATVQLTSDLFDKDANGHSILNTVNINGTGIEFNSQLLVGYADNYTFVYNIVIDTLYDPCLVNNICFNCVYDLEIKIVDECGVNVALIGGQPIKETIGHFSYDNDGHITLVFDCANPTELNLTKTFSEYLQAGNFTVTKILSINQKAEDTFIHAWLNPSFNSCVLTLQDFIDDAMQNLDTSGCHITCLSCVQSLGSRDSFVALGYGSALKYDFLAEECMKPCHSTSWCAANYSMMLLDMSPDGQYGEYRDVNTGVIDPGIFPLSVYNEDNHLPGTNYNWRHPFIVINGATYNSFIEEDGDLSTITLSGSPGSFMPELYDPAKYYYSPQTGYYTYPENLKFLHDFITAWKPSWARSLLKYHPEYCYYENCRQSSLITQGDLLSSDDFDGLLENATTYDDGVARGLIINNSQDPSPINRITKWWDHTNGVFDPFMVYSGGDTYNNDLKNRMLNYTSVNGYALDIVGYAAYLTRCEGIPNQFISNPDCIYFGNGIGNQHFTDSIRNKEWTILKGLYLGLKREYQFLRTNAYAISTCGNYNGCIGEADWSPYGTPSAPPNFYAPNHPCSSGTYQYYWDKQKRFIDPAEVPLGLNDPQQIAYQNYILTGQCPLAATFQILLSELATGGNLVNNISLNNSPAFNGLYYHLTSSMPDPSDNYDWKYILLNSDMIEFTILKNSLLFYTGVLDKSGIGIPWEDFKVFDDIHVYSYDGHNSYFTIKAGVFSQPNSPNPYNYYLLSNSSTNNINLDIFNCNFSPASTVNEFAVDISMLMSALAANHKLLNINVALHPAYDAKVSATILNWLGVANTNSLVWKYSSLLSRLEINAPGNKSIYIYVTGFEPSNFIIGNLANVAYFNNMVCDNYNYFAMDGYTTSNSFYVVAKGYIVLNNNGVISPISTGNVSLPESVLCEGPFYKTTQSFFQLVNDILVNRDLNNFTNIFTELFMTTELATLFYPGTISSATYHTHQTLTAFYDTLNFEGICSFILTHSNQLPPALYMNNITKVLDIELTGSPDEAGNYHNFYIIAQFQSGEDSHIDTVFGSVCIPLRLCECEDSLGTAFIPSFFSEYSNGGSGGEETSYLTEVSGSISISQVDSSYAKYASAVELVNSEILSSQGDTVAALSQNDFFAGGFAYSTENYEKFTEHFHSEIDSTQYAKDIQSFVLDYGNDTRADKEYDRYTEAVKYYNEYAQQNNLSALVIVSDSEFYSGLYADTIYSYIDYLIFSVKNNEEAVNVAEYYQTNSSGLSYDDCEEEYKSYANAYLFFSDRQKQNLTCPNWEVISPFISYEGFLKANLCCSEAGQSLLDDYIRTFYDTTQCPGPLTGLESCEESAESKAASAKDCQSFYQDYANLINQYNSSYYATATGHYLTIYYNTYDAFVAARLCDCYPLYYQFLYAYLYTTNLQLPAPSAIAVFCNIVNEAPDPCVASYDDYSMAVIAYNDFAKSGEYPMAPVYSYDEIKNSGYCDCINSFIKFLESIRFHLIPNSPTLKDQINSYFVNCSASLKPPCTERLFDSIFIAPPVPPGPDPCVAQLINTAIYNATNAYNNYIDSLIGVIANNYATHCLHAFEKFDATYDFKEYHFTLYYYDQAGNLIKTVPPEGVEPIAVTSSYDPLEQQIIADRTYHTHTVFTSHRLYSLYDYNSLNQLVKQSLPDHDKMDIFDPEVPFGINPDVKVTAIQFVSESRGYLSGYVDAGPNAGRGYFYTTTDGGHRWQFNSTVPGSNLKKIAWMSSTEGYAVGSDGTFIKTSDGGHTWDLMNTYINNLSIYNFNDLIISNSILYLGGKKGKILSSADGGSTFSSVSINQGGSEITSITSDGVFIYFALTENYPGIYPSQGSKILWLKISDGSYGSAVLYPLNILNIRNYGKAKAYAVGMNGALVKRIIINGTYYWISLESKLKLNFQDVDFISDNVGIALCEDDLHQGFIYRTVDGGISWKLLSDPHHDYNAMCVFNTSDAIHKILFVGNDLSVFNHGLALKISYFPDSNFAVIPLHDIPTGSQVLAVWAIEHGSNLIAIATDYGGKAYTNTNANYLSSSWGSPYSIPGGSVIKIAAKYYTTLGTFDIRGVFVGVGGHPKYFHFTPNGITTNSTVPDYSHVCDAQMNGQSDQVLFYDQNTSTPRFYYLNLVSAQPYNATQLVQTTMASTIFYHFDVNSDTILASSFAAYEGDLAMGKINGNSVTMTNESPLYRAAPLRDIQAATSDNVFACGNTGTMLCRKLNTTDRFSTLICNTVRDINAMKFRSNTLGYAVTDSGGIYTISYVAPSAGFSALDLSCTHDLYDIALSGTAPNFISYAVGADGTIRYNPDIANAGTFSNLLVTNPVDLYGVSFKPGESIAWIVGDHARVHEASGSNQLQIPYVFLPPVKSFNFTDEDNGYLVSDKFNIRQTHDGGITWNIVIPAAPGIGNTYPTLVTLKSIDAFHSYIGGNSRKFVTAVDKQATISDFDFQGAAPNNSSSNILALALSNVDNTLKYMLVRNGINGYFIQHGSSWTVANSYLNTGKYPKALWVFRNDNVALAGTQSLLEFYNGASITSIYPSGSQFPTGATAGINFNAIAFYDDINGYAAGDKGFLIKSKDWTFDTYPFVINAEASWERKRMKDNLTITDDDSTNVTINAIATPGRFWLMTGGSYNNSGNLSKPPGYCRLTHDESIVYSTRFWYDRVGRLILSQNTKQFNQDPKQYSYCLYDGLGRMIEAGVKSENNSGDPQFTSIFGAWVSNYYNPNVSDDAKLNTWITLQATTRTEVTHTYYDVPVTGIALPNDFTQDNLRKRIAMVSYEDTYDDNVLTYNYATHYSYDIHGNVKSLLQDNPHTDVASEQFKRMEYDYDLISGKVNEVQYQAGKADEWDHRYTYDADNRIKTAETSDNRVLWDQDIKYFYYQHGPLARTEIGNNQVQGIDYVYTLQGWMKGINSTTLDASRDAGQDGLSTSVNAQFATDAFSYSLGFFVGDYQPIDYTNKWNVLSSRFISDPSGSQMLGFRNDLFNGNISYMMTSIVNPQGDQKLPQATAYKYDQLNRLLEEGAFVNLNPGTNQWQPANGSYDFRYYNSFSYDANGNILTQQRHDQSGNQIENLTYNYFHDSNNGEVFQNRLYSVNETINQNAYPDDIDDQGLFNNDPGFVNVKNNYAYTELGELKQDTSEKIINIIWRTDGKIKEVARYAGSSQKNLKFEYDPMGNRIAKHVYESDGVTWDNSTYYVRDAQGNIMATYSKTADIQNATLSYKLIERYIYGSSRVGIFNDTVEMIGATLDPDYSDHFLRKREYEGVNHLGNVLTVFTDRKIPLDGDNDGILDGFKADLLVSQDYYPFGVVMQGRNFFLEKYRLGFNGKENINEIEGAGNWQDYGMRMYSLRLGRFPSVDPLTKKYPSLTPYQFSSNSPIQFIDIDGMEGGKPAETNKKSGETTAAIDNTYNNNTCNIPLEPKEKVEVPVYPWELKTSDPGMYDDLQNVGAPGTAAFFGQGVIIGLQGEGMGAAVETAIRGGGRIIKVLSEASDEVVINTLQTISKAVGWIAPAIKISNPVFEIEAFTYFCNMARSGNFAMEAFQEGVVYSGRANRQAAESFIKNANGKYASIADTPTGRLLEQANLYSENSLLTVQQADEVMKIASESFIRQNSQAIFHSFVSGADPVRLYMQVEAPILKSQGNIVFPH